MIFPTIHLNGTSKNQLSEQWMRATDAVREAMRIVQEEGPNARDYYPQGQDVFYKAQAEHVERLRKLDDVYNELRQIMEHVIDA